MLRNNGGLSVLRGRLGVQVVVDNHTIDDSLWLHGWNATKRAQHGQGPVSVQKYRSVQEDGFYPTCSTFRLYNGGSSVARNVHEITTRTQIIVACDRGACWGALESLLGGLG